MTSFTPPIFIIPLLVTFLCFSAGNANSQLPENTHSINGYNYDNYDDGSIVPTRPCKRPKITPEEYPWYGGASMLVMNRWCGVDKDSLPSEKEFMEYDAARVRAIQVRLGAPPASAAHTEEAQLEAQPGLKLFGATGYVVEVKIGTPPQPQLLMFDTGSEMTWVQCKTCELGKCFPHKKDLFDPDHSKPILCKDPECNKLPHHQCEPQSSPCHLDISYADQSEVFGEFYKDNLDLGSEVVLKDYIFGCTTNYTEEKEGSTLRGFSGILGLADAEGSFVNQARRQFNGRYFSYCLPTGKGKDQYGHLTLGRSDKLRSTGRSRFSLEILRNDRREYLVALEDITVGEKRLGIDKAVFRATKGTLIDSGTYGTRLPKAAYEALRDEFIRQMKDYKRAGPNEPFYDTCYNLTSYPNPQHIPIPRVTLHFKGQDQIQLHPEGVMGGKYHQRCLLFTPIGEGDPVSIIGYKAQQTFDIIYDLDHRTILFGLGGCD